LMTMHKSKGLEFDTVMLPGLGRKPRANDSQLVSWMPFLDSKKQTEQGDMHKWLVVAPLDQKGQDSSLLTGLLKRFDQTKESNELARLLYVAATRAKTQLHLFGSIAFKESAKDNRIAPTKSSLLEALWPCVKTEFERLCCEYEESESESEGEKPLPKVSRVPLEHAPFSELLQFKAYKVPVELTQPSTLTAQTDLVIDNLNEAMTPEQALLNTSVGNLVHLVLELIVDEGIENWNVALVETRAPFYKQWLKQQGLGGELLNEGLRRVLVSLNHAVKNPIVCWALDGSHQASRTEYPLTSFDEETQSIANHIVDRTYIDEHGVRWIVDYKTSVFDGDKQQTSAFIENKIELYRSQLERYGALFEEVDGHARAQKWVLYFSYLDRWVEVADEA